MACENHGVVRPDVPKYHPSVWGDYFILENFPPSALEKSKAWIKERVAELVSKVKILLKNNSENQLQELELIDALERLGVGYHFEKEFDEKLRKIHTENNDDDAANDLHFVALRFRLLRQHSYYVSADVFYKFKDDEGQFKANLSKDAKGLLSLYDATYLSTPAEDILADAANFAKNHLKALMQSNIVGPTLVKKISDSLRTPLRRRMLRIEARDYIDIYQSEEERNRNETVLELAKLDFHLLQLLHREEVKILCKWWKELGLLEKITFTKDRVVESYFWALGVYFEPHYSKARIFYTKIILHFCVMDDIYDSYGTLDELRIYTQSVQRWGLEGLDQLNELLRFHYLALYDTVKDIENELTIEELSYSIPYLEQTIKKSCRAWLAEAEWRDAGYVPSLKEYLEVSLLSGCYPTLACVSFLGMGQIATKPAFDWIFNLPKIVQSIAIIARLKDDLVSSELEEKRVHVATAIQCYMKENDVSLEKACEGLQEIVEHLWKEVNQEVLVESTQISMHLLDRLVNLTRVLEPMYEVMDAYTDPTTTLKNYITRILVQPIL